MTVKIDKGSAAGLINLTPMIDVVFQLLLFFLVASRFADEERQLKVVLPQASEARPLTARPSEFSITIDRAGRYYVDGRQMAPEMVEPALRKAAANNPGRQTVIIRADKRADVEHAVFVMNACNKASIFDYRLTTAEESRRASGH